MRDGIGGRAGAVVLGMRGMRRRCWCGGASRWMMCRSRRVCVLLFGGLVQDFGSLWGLCQATYP